MITDIRGRVAIICVVSVFLCVRAVAQEGYHGVGYDRGYVPTLGKIYGTIEAWRNRPIEGEHPYVYLDGIVLAGCARGPIDGFHSLVE
jgi:hypothetical protein